MKIFLLTLCLALSVLAEETYEAVGDDFNVSEVLQNVRLLKSYANCLVDKGPCTPEVKKVKEKLPEALATRCAKCSAQHKEMAKQLSQGVRKNHPKIWEELVAHYDADGKYQDTWKDFLGEK